MTETEVQTLSEMVAYQPGAGVPHALDADVPFKMMLVMIKDE